MKKQYYLIYLSILSLLLNSCIQPSLQSSSQPNPSSTQPSTGTIFRDRLLDGSLGPEMVWIPAGTFQMGDIQGDDSSNEQPVHEVSVAQFAMGRYEVTFAEYDKFAQAIGRKMPDDRGWGRGNRPVISVLLHDVMAYANWLSQQTGRNYRLPTEAEWEYAARAGSNTKYWWGNEIGKNRAVCYGCGAKWGFGAPKKTAPVGSFRPNPFGLYDTVGNVSEWTCSEYEARYNGKEKRCASNDHFFVNGKEKRCRYDDNRFALRGGSWIDNASMTRATSRSSRKLTISENSLGARLALSPPGLEQSPSIVQQEPSQQEPPQQEPPQQEPPQQEPPRQPGTVFRDRLLDGSLGPEMVVIPAGRFQMGNIQGDDQGDDHNHEQPVHEVSVAQFAMGRYEVTFAEYDKFAQATGKEMPNDQGWGRGNRPVINVSWFDVVAYTKWLSQQTGQNYRLPTEAEWDYAARAGSNTKYWWSNEIGENRAACGGCGAKWGKDAKRKTAPVGSFPPNPFGLYDTVGNVWEWTCSESEAPYNGKEKRCVNNACNQFFIVRGGSWNEDAQRAQVTHRYRLGADPMSISNNSTGFRLVKAKAPQIE